MKQIASSSPIYSLPTELHLQIFAYLPTKELCRCVLLSSLFCNLLYHSPHLWKRLNLSNTRSLGDKTSRVNAEIEILLVNSIRFSFLTHLGVSYNNINLEVFETIHIPNLTHLYLDGCDSIDSGSLFYLSKLPRLTNLDISHCQKIDDFGFEVIAFYLPGLVKLDATYLLRVTDVGVNKLFKLRFLKSLNLLGCYRVRSYPWALAASGKKQCGLTSLLLGEDVRVHNGGFWLLWCCWSWEMNSFVSICSGLEILKINMVLFELPAEAWSMILTNFKNLKELGMVIDPGSVDSLVQHSEKLQSLDSLEVTCHIALTKHHMSRLISSKCLSKLNCLKFHSKNTSVFTNQNLVELTKLKPNIESLELNAIKCSEALISLVDLSQEGQVPTSTTTSKKKKNLETLFIHHGSLSNDTLSHFSKRLKTIRELTFTNLKEVDIKNKLSNLTKPHDQNPEKNYKQRRQEGLDEYKFIIQKKVGSDIGLNLKKIEISSLYGFSDTDLSSIPKHCQQLQWIEFSFNFTFPKTLTSIADHCPKLLFLKLCRYVTPAIPVKEGVQKEIKKNFHATSKEIRSLIHFTKNGGKLLKIFDLSGDLGISDHIIISHFTKLSIHTLSIENANYVTSKGLIKFAESKWKSLKRISIKNCTRAKFDCVEGNFVRNSLGIELVVDAIRI